jgi:predicted nucleic acid-binding protein
VWPSLTLSAFASDINASSDPDIASTATRTAASAHRPEFDLAQLAVWRTGPNTDGLSRTLMDCRRRFADLLIAAVALANALPLVTRNATDFAGLNSLIDVVEI